MWARKMLVLQVAWRTAVPSAHSDADAAAPGARGDVLAQLGQRKGEDVDQHEPLRLAQNGSAPLVDLARVGEAVDLLVAGLGPSQR